MREHSDTVGEKVFKGSPAVQLFEESLQSSPNATDEIHEVSKASNDQLERIILQRFRTDSDFALKMHRKCMEFISLGEFATTSHVNGRLSWAETRV